MNANVGGADKVVRLVLALVLFSLYFFLDGGLKWIALLGFVPLVTGLVNWCPLYTIFGINTCRK